ncbi:MAG: hypothetical protein GKR95_24780 [Gammaproteobacteria bacterium]|nr:hypothetical protein [Gammaproteobacteria bacterium]NKB65177.1 hypothetical protein [Gammaproteobacteria bacterium]
MSEQTLDIPYSPAGDYLKRLPEKGYLKRLALFQVTSPAPVLKEIQLPFMVVGFFYEFFMNFL